MKVRHRHGYIELNNGTAWWYDIRGERIRNESELIGWLAHLSEKNWFTGEHCSQMIDVVYAMWGREVPR